MKRSLLVFILLVSPGSFAYGAQDIDSRDSYAIFVGVAGAFTTGVSLLFWYFHQNMLKQDFAKRESELSHNIDRLRGALNLPIEQNAHIVRIGAVAVRESRFLTTGFPQTEGNRRDVTDFIAGDLGSLPPAYISRPPSFHSASSMDTHTQVQRPEWGDELVGSRSPSPSRVQYGNLSQIEV